MTERFGRAEYALTKRVQSFLVEVTGRFSAFRIGKQCFPKMWIINDYKVVFLKISSQNTLHGGKTFVVRCKDSIYFWRGPYKWEFLWAKLKGRGKLHPMPWLLSFIITKCRYYYSLSLPRMKTTVKSHDPAQPLFSCVTFMILFNASTINW